MTLRKLPQASAPARPKNFQWDAPSDVLARWAEAPQAATDDSETTITIYDVIGEDWWSGGGFTDKRMAAALRAIGQRDVTVNINSPGGDMFDGIAIYNQLVQHKGRVTVNVMGLAASAASIIAMAGDTINMATGSFLMIHNAWGVVVGNKLDMRASADVFDGFDGALADIYQARTGVARAEIVALMDGETFMNASEAIKRGFADAQIDGPQRGLDYYYDHSDRAMQQALFRRHIAVSRATGLPLIVHTRDAEADTAAILTEEMEQGAFPALIHCFTASAEFGAKMLELGLTISISGIVTFKNAKDLQAVAAALPEDRLLVETDAPFLAPVPHRGKVCEPSFVADTARFVADLRGTTAEALADATTANFLKLFSKARL